MSHIVGTIQRLSTAMPIGPQTGPATSGSTWSVTFAPTPAPTGTKFVMLHFRFARLPGADRLEVDLGYGIGAYGTDVFVSANGTDFWTRPIAVHKFPNG